MKNLGVFLLVVAAGALSNLAAQYLVNNVRTVRRIVGPL